METAAKKTKWDAKQIVGTAIGFAVGLYAGVHIMMPIAGMVLSAILVNKFGSQPLKDATGLFTVQAGYFLYLGLSGVLTGQLVAVAVDLLVLGIGLGWFVARPGPRPLYLLLVYQAVGVALNGWNFVQMPLGSFPSRALSAHLGCRLLAAGLMVGHLLKIRAQNIAQPSITEQL